MKGLSFSRDQRIEVESLMKKAFANLTGDLAGTYYPLTGMEEKVGDGASILKGLYLETKLALSMYKNNLSSYRTNPYYLLHRLW